MINLEVIRQFLHSKHSISATVNFPVSRRERADHYSVEKGVTFMALQNMWDEK
jgi:hypothetical protein